MVSTPIDATTIGGLEAMLPQERARLVRFCAHLCGDADAAEDLAQETLIEAWRHADRLYDPQGYDRWLSAIARNVCLRWLRQHGRMLAHAAPPAAYDLELSLERDEFADLLDTALALLPPKTRAALVARYIEGTPHAEIAARLGTTEGAVAVRLHRGKLALRRLLETDLRADAAAYGLVDGEPDGWTETRIWCPRCGCHRLRGRFDRDPHTGAFLLRCPRCYPNDREGLNFVGTYFAYCPDRVSLLHGMKGWRPALSRVMADTHQYYRRGFTTGAVRCMHCGRPARLHRWWHPPSSIHPAMHGVSVLCDGCHRDPTPNESLHGLMLGLPEGRRFWREHPHLRALPEREVEAGGVPALVAVYEDVTGSARFAAVVARDTYAIIAIDGVVPGDDACN